MSLKDRTPLIAEIVAGGTLVAVLGLAASWGGLVQQVRDHIDPGKHAGVVLAGTIETERNITTIQTNLSNVDGKVQKNTDDIDEIKKDVGEIKTSVEVIIILQQQTLDEAKRAREAAEARNGGP